MAKVSSVSVVAGKKRKASAKSTNAFHGKKLVVKKRNISRARRLARRASFEASVTSVYKKIGVTADTIINYLLPDETLDNFLRLSY